MTPEQKNIKICEFRGWKNLWETEHQGWRGDNPYGSGDTFTPDHFGDLNAMHEAERVLRRDPLVWIMFVDKLNETLSMDDAIHATAAQRAEAFGITLNLWTP